MARRLSHRLSTRFVLAVLACGSLSAAGLASTVTQRGTPLRAGSPDLRLSAPAVGTTSNTWMLGRPAPTHQFTGAAAVVGTNIYLLGGENHTTVLGENDVYDTLTNKWSRARPMPTKRATLAAVALNGLVYAIGGSTFTGVPLATVEAYDPMTNRWTTKASLPTAVDSMTATVENGFIYVVGGFNNSNGQPFGGVQVYDPTGDAWTSVAPLNVAKSFAFTTAVGTQIVAAAGSIGTGPTTDNELYDPTSNLWTTKSNALSARYAGCVGAIGGSLYAAAGLRFTPIRSASRELDRYDVAGDHWTTLRRMPFGVLGPASAVVNGRLYCIGGSPRLGQPVFSGRVQIYQP